MRDSSKYKARRQGGRENAVCNTETTQTVANSAVDRNGEWRCKKAGES